MSTFRGPIRPSRRVAVRHPDQLGLPVSRPPTREIRWEPGDPIHEPPAEVDPDPRPAVLADEPTDPDAARWRPDDVPLIPPPAGQVAARPGRVARRRLGRRVVGSSSTSAVTYRSSWRS